MHVASLHSAFYGELATNPHIALIENAMPAPVLSGELACSARQHKSGLRAHFCSLEWAIQIGDNCCSPRRSGLSRKKTAA